MASMSENKPYSVVETMWKLSMEYNSNCITSPKCQ